MSRYRILRGAALVIHPDGEKNANAVDLVLDLGKKWYEKGEGHDRALGVRLIGDGPLAGTVILVAEAWIEKLKADGEPADDLETLE